MRLPLIACIALFASTAAAQNSAPPPPPPLASADTPATASAPAPAPEEPKRLASVTFSPIHLAQPIVEVTTEFALHDKIGVAAILGYGSVSATAGTQSYRFRAYEAGAHFNYYVLGTFNHGMQLGLEALYAKVMTDGNVQISGAANGFAVGPYVGYKLITRIGFTFEANGGVQYLAMRGNATDGRTTVTGTSNRWIPLVNLNVGWSF